MQFFMNSRSMREGREERTKDLVCILNVDFNYKHRFRDIIFAGKDAGKKLAIAYCRAPTTIPHPEYLKRNPLWIVKQTKTILLLLFLHLSLPFPSFVPFPLRDFFLFLISWDGEISCWILIRSSNACINLPESDWEIYFPASEQRGIRTRSEGIVSSSWRCLLRVFLRVDGRSERVC